MVAQSRRQHLTLPAGPVPLARFAGVAAALITTAMIALIPVGTLETLILRSGVPAVLAAAEPPLGFTARIVMILLGGTIAGLIFWLGTFLLVGDRSVVVGGSRRDGNIPVLRRADAHPDAPAREPLFATRDLGTPFLDIRAGDPGDQAQPVALNATSDADPAWSEDEQRPLPILRSPIDLPADLDEPMAAYDPAAIPDTPLAPPAPPPPPLGVRPQVIDSGERFETFQLRPAVTPVVDEARPAVARPPVDTAATLTALLERLERGVSERAERAPSPEPSANDAGEQGLQHTLGMLRRMATRA